MKQLSAVVLAGGYGSFAGFAGVRVSKLAAKLDGKPMIRHVLSTLRNLSLIDKFYVVVNQEYERQIKCALQDLSGLTFVRQPHRLGSAGATELALLAMDGEESDVIITFGDMPLWQPFTFQNLIHRHLSFDQPQLTLATIPLVPGTNPARYGRILRSGDGRILGTIDDPALIPKGQIVQADEVNPSLYAAKTRWLKHAIGQIKPFDKRDGYPPERCLQSVIYVANKQGDRVAEIRVDDLDQALGVNSKQELREVRRVFQRRFALQAMAA